MDSLDAVNQAIADSLNTHNIPFVVQAINQGKREARDSDEYYNFVTQDIVPADKVGFGNEVEKGFWVV